MAQARKLSEVQELLLKAVVERHSVVGGSTPGLVLSWIPEKGMFYGSVVKYTRAFGEGKMVVYARMAKDVVTLTRMLAQELVRETDVDKLRRAV